MFHVDFFNSGLFEYKYVVLNNSDVVFDKPKVILITKSRYAPDRHFLGYSCNEELPQAYLESSVVRLATKEEIQEFCRNRIAFLTKICDDFCRSYLRDIEKLKAEIEK